MDWLIVDCWQLELEIDWFFFKYCFCTNTNTTNGFTSYVDTQKILEAMFCNHCHLYLLKEFSEGSVHTATWDIFSNTFSPFFLDWTLGKVGTGGRTDLRCLKQGSSENDGRSDVYDCSEFKIVSNCGYPNRSRTYFGNFANLGNIPEYTARIYLNLPEFTWNYLKLPNFTLTNLNLPNFTMNLPDFTWFYLNFP